MDVKTGRNQDKPAHCESRKRFYDWLAETIQIDGIERVRRDHEFDDEKYRSGGIRLHYNNTAGPLTSLKDGILLEVGFDDVTPNTPKDISSWAYDYAAGKVPVIDNRAKTVACYHAGYTLVEKLQTISTKYRQHYRKHKKKRFRSGDNPVIAENELSFSMIQILATLMSKPIKIPVRSITASSPVFLTSC